MNKKVLLYIHGKGGSAEEAKHYQTLLHDYQVIGFDYKGTNPWETKDEFRRFYQEICQQYPDIKIIANSIGAYFTMNALSTVEIKQAFFISPIVDMKQLITDMMLAEHITLEELEKKKEIKTSFGETLSWKYFCYVKEHPILWNTPTHILYGKKDALTSFEKISSFAKIIKASLTIMENGEHWFHTEEQMAFLDHWLKQHIA